MPPQPIRYQIRVQNPCYSSIGIFPLGDRGSAGATRRGADQDAVWLSVLVSAVTSGTNAPAQTKRSAPFASFAAWRRNSAPTPSAGAPSPTSPPGKRCARSPGASRDLRPNRPISTPTAQSWSNRPAPTVDTSRGGCGTRLRRNVSGTRRISGWLWTGSLRSAAGQECACAGRTDDIDHCTPEHCSCDCRFA